MIIVEDFCVPLYVLKYPSGIILQETVAKTVGEAWDNAWDFGRTCGAGGLIPFDGGERAENADATRSRYFEYRFWKRRGPMIRFMKRHGYRVVRVSLKEEE